MKNRSTILQCSVLFDSVVELTRVTGRYLCYLTRFSGTKDDPHKHPRPKWSCDLSVVTEMREKDDVCERRRVHNAFHDVRNEV